MSYFTLPKINNVINVFPQDTEDKYYVPYISNSLFNYYNEICEQIKSCIINTDISLNTFNELVKIVNPYEYIFSKVPCSKFSVSKLKPNTNFFYEILEISTSLNIFELYKSNIINTLHLTQNNNDAIECFEMFRENYRDKNKYYDEINDETIKLICDEKFDFLFFEAKFDNLDNYIISIIKILMIIYRNQKSQGTCIIKINQVFYKPVIDFIYILSSLYDKTYIFKPNTSNITSFDKYIICKNFQINENKLKLQKMIFLKLLVFLKKLEGKKIQTILDYEIPYYFLTKIDDINIIIGQQQLESLDMVINILKNKNKEEKIEIIKKTGIQKSVAWCEKYKIPFNRFYEKTNIFLPINKEIDNENNF